MKLMIIFCILIKALYFIKTQRLYKPVKANTMNILFTVQVLLIHSNIVQIIGEFQSGTAVFAEHKIVYLGAILLISSQHIFADEVGNMSSPILLALKGTCYLSWRECFVLRASCEPGLLHQQQIRQKKQNMLMQRVKMRYKTNFCSS